MPEVKAPSVRPRAMARVNTRIRLNQQKYIKSQAKKCRATEGEIFRAAIDVAMKTGKKLIK